MNNTVALTVEAFLRRAQETLPNLFSIARQIVPGSTKLTKVRLMCSSELTPQRQVRPQVYVIISGIGDTPPMLTLGRFEGDDPYAFKTKLSGFSQPSNHAVLKLNQQVCAIEDAAQAVIQAHPFEDYSLRASVDAASNESEMDHFSINGIPLMERTIACKFDNVTPVIAHASQKLAELRGQGYDPATQKKYYLSRPVKSGEFNMNWSADAKQVVSGIAYSRDEAKISLLGVSNHPGIAADIFSRLAESNVNVDMIVQADSRGPELANMVFTCTERDSELAVSVLQDAKDKIGFESVVVDRNVAKVSVIGVGMRSHTGVAKTMFDALSAKGINIQVISTSEIKISVLIDASYTELAVRALHTAYGLDAGS